MLFLRIFVEAGMVKFHACAVATVLCRYLVYSSAIEAQCCSATKAGSQTGIDLGSVCTQDVFISLSGMNEHSRHSVETDGFLLFRHTSIVVRLLLPASFRGWARTSN